MNIPKGWKLVPVEPTLEMAKAGGHVNSEWLNDAAPLFESRYTLPIPGVWEKMLAAAPTPPVHDENTSQERVHLPEPMTDDEILNTRVFAGNGTLTRLDRVAFASAIEAEVIRRIKEVNE